MAPGDDFLDALLDRNVAIVKTIPQSGGGYLFASKYVWELPDQFPRIVCSIARCAPDYVASGFQYMTYDLNVSNVLLGGPLGAGAIHQSEDNVNKHYFAYLKKLALYTDFELPKSNGDPDTSQAFDFLEAGTPVKVLPSGAITQFNYGEPPNTTKFIGTTFTLSMRLYVSKR